MTAIKNPELLSVEDYLIGEANSPVKHEYLGGVDYAMAGGSNRHNDISGNAFASLFFQLKGKPCRPSNSDTKVRIDTKGVTRFYYPDALVSCDRNDDEDSYQEKPAVIVEVLSKSTRRLDTNEKCDAYLSIPTLKIYLIVEQERPVVTVHRRRLDGGFEAEYYSSLRDSIPLPEIEANLTMAELYDRINFPVA